MEADSTPREVEPALLVPEPPPLVASEPNPFITAALPPPPPPPVVEPVLPVVVPPLPPPRAITRVLAGIESGVIGAAVMVLWFAIDSLLERQYWWAMLNLWGASVYHNRVFSMGFGVATLVGVSTHFFLHGVGGAIWSLIAGRMSNYWLHLLLSFGAAAVWYLVLMHGFWPAVAPVVSRITPSPATFLAYVLFGAAISRIPYRARQLGMIWET